MGSFKDIFFKLNCPLFIIFALASQYHFISGHCETSRWFLDSSSIDADSLHRVQDVEVGSDLPSVRGPAEPRRIVIPP